MNASELIDAARREIPCRSDYALAKYLGVGRQTVSQWRSGVQNPNSLAIFKLAHAARLDPALVLAELEADRAERAGRMPEAVEWRGWVRSLGGVAAALAIGTAIVGPGPARAAYGSAPKATGERLYIMSTGRRRRLARWLDSLRRLDPSAEGFATA